MKQQVTLITGWIDGVGKIEITEDKIINGCVSVIVGFDSELFENIHAFKPIAIWSKAIKNVNVPDAREAARLEAGDCTYNKEAGCLMFSAR